MACDCLDHPDDCMCSFTAGLNAAVAGSGAIGDPLVITGGPLVYATFGALPTPGVDSPEADEGSFAWVLDTRRLYYSNGAAWAFVLIASPSHCLLHKNADQTISVGLTVGEVLTWETETDDGDSLHTGSSSRITFNVGGVWLVGTDVVWKSPASGANTGWICRTQIRLNAAGDPTAGTVVARAENTDTNGSVNAPQHAECCRRFSAGDYVEVAVQHNDSDVNLDVLSGAETSQFWAQFVAA